MRHLEPEGRLVINAIRKEERDKSHGIYAFEGERLKLVITKRSDDTRPSKFEPAKDIAVLTLEKIPVPAGADVSKDLEHLQGVWKVVSAEGAVGRSSAPVGKRPS